MIAWKDDWNIGIDIIDAEHKKLIDLLSQIERDAEARSPYLRTAILSASSEVINHITNHFSHEEQISPQYLSAEDYASHVKDHRRWKQLLLKETAELQMKLSEQASTEELVVTALRFAETLYSFFTKHFYSHDCKFCSARCLDR